MITNQIQPVKFRDTYFDEDFIVTTSLSYTTITIGKRSFFFNPDGTFDGTGTDLRSD